jgi:hypothetical protein
MKPNIERTQFGSITVEGESYNHDIVIRLDGKIVKRKKKLSKQIYGTSHILSLAEAEFIYEDGARQLIIGNGQSGILGLSDEAQAFFGQKGVEIELLPTPQAILAWNDARGAVIGLFHVTC